jgi:hypothetical protein
MKVMAVLALSGLFALYGAERYSALTREEVAYVYHPETDNVYTVVFGAAPDRLFKKHLLLPFHSPSREIKVAEEHGTMHYYLREKAARDTLFSLGRAEDRSESLSTEWVRWAGNALDSVRVFGYRWDFPDLAWVPRRDVDPQELLPLEFRIILPIESVGWFWDEVYAVDAVVLKEQLGAARDAVRSNPNQIEVLEKAVMIRGAAAKYVDQVLFGG